MLDALALILIGQNSMLSMPNFKEVKEIPPMKEGFIFVIIYFLSLLHIVHNLIWKAKLVSGRIGIKNIYFL